MKAKLSPHRRWRSLLLASCLAVGATTSRAADGTWTNLGSGTWSNSGNWLNGSVPGGSNAIANLSTIDVPWWTTYQQLRTNVIYGTSQVVTVSYPVPASFTNSLDSSRTNGGMLFGDTVTSTPGSWVLDSGTADAPYTLALLGTNNEIQVGMSTNVLVTITNIVTITTNASMAVVTNNTTMQLPGGYVVMRAQLVDGMADDSSAIPSGFVKTGPGTLVIVSTNSAYANTYSAGTILSNGTLMVGGPTANINISANQNALGTGPITFKGGTLSLWGSERNNLPSNGSPGTLGNNLIVPAGQTGTIMLPGYVFPAMNGTLTGGGTLNIRENYVRGDVAGDWTAFTGTVNVYSRAGGDFRPTVSTVSLPNGVLNLTTNPANATYTIWMYSKAAAGTTFTFGELRGESIATINAGTGSGGGQAFGMVLQVGGLNTDATYAGTLTSGSAGGGLAIIKEGTGTWTWTGAANTQLGDLTINAGTLQIGGTAGTLGWSTNVFVNSTLAFNRPGTLVVSNLFQGAGTIAVRGSGTLDFIPRFGTNAFTGKIVASSGVVAISTEAALGSDPGVFTADLLTLNGGCLRGKTTLTIDDTYRGVTLGANGGGLGADTNTTLTVASTIAGSGSLTISNTGTVVLSGANTYSGSTILNAGTLALAGEAPLGAAPGVARANQITFNGGTFRSTATFAIDDSNRGVTVGAAGGILAPDSGTTLTLAEPIVGTGALTKTGAGTVTINAADSHTGSTIVSQGTLALGASGSITASAMISVESGATFDVSAAGYALGSGQTLGGNGTVAGNLTAASGSTLNPGLSVGTLAVTGNLTLNGGTNLVEISATTNDVINVAGNLSISGPSTITLSLLSSLPVGTYQLIKYAGTFSGSAASLTLAGYPTSRLTASLAHNAATKSIDLVIAGAPGSLVWVGGANGNAWDTLITTNWINGSSLDYFYGGDSVTFNALGSANPTVQLAGTLSAGVVTTDATTDYTFAGAGKLTGPASLVKQNTGKLTVLTLNDYFGSTILSSGTLQVGDGTTAGSLGSGEVTDNGSLIFNPPTALTNTASITGTGSLAKLGTGSLTLPANNSYAGATTIGGGTLQVGVGGSTGSLGAGGVANDGALVYKRTGTVTNSGAITGTGSLTVQGGVTVALASDNSYGGATLIDGSTLQLGTGAASGTLGTAGIVTLTNKGSLVFNRAGEVTNSVVIVGAGNLVQNGPGRLTVVSTNTYTGQTVINGGSVQVGDGATTGYLGTNDIVNNGTLTFNQPVNVTNTSTMTGTGRLIMDAPNRTLTLSPASRSTYSGGTVISNSTIALFGPGTGAANPSANDYGLGTGEVTLLAGATLSTYGFGLNDPAGVGFGTLTNTLIVPAGQTANFLASPRYAMNGRLTGSGTFNYTPTWVRGDIGGDWSAFTGTINLVTSTNIPQNPGSGDFRVAAATGFGGAAFDIGSASVYYTATPAADNTTTVDFGDLSGPTNAWLGGSPVAGRTINWRVGSRNGNATYAGSIADSTGPSAIIKVGTGTWTVSGSITNSGSCSISNGVLVLTGNAGLSNAAAVTVVSPGVLSVAGLPGGTLYLGESIAQTLAGNGSISGSLYLGGAASITLDDGPLTISGSANLQGGATININRTNSPTSGRLVAARIILGGNGLTVNNNGEVIHDGDTFQLLSAPTITGTFGSLSLPALPPGASWDSSTLYTAGTIKAVVLPPALVVTNNAGASLEFSWDAAHLGYQVQVQTNSIGVGLSTNWVPVLGSESGTSYSLPLDKANGTVFLRLSYPPQQ